jgi:hypothetical protein
MIEKITQEFTLVIEVTASEPCVAMLEAGVSNVAQLAGKLLNSEPVMAYEGGDRRGYEMVTDHFRIRGLYHCDDMKLDINIHSTLDDLLY